MGKFIDKYKIYKITLVFQMGLSTFFYSCFYITFPLGNSTLMLMNVIFAGLSSAPAAIVMLPLMVELTYPLSEGLTF